MNSLNLAIAKNKLKTIALLKFSTSLRQLKLYLNLINWLRDYVAHYVVIAKSLQLRKTKLLRDDSTTSNVKKAYSSKTRLRNATKDEVIVFRTLQDVLSKSFYLIYASSKRSLYVNLDVNKKFDFYDIIYHVKKSWLRKSFVDWDYSSRIAIELILFLSRFLKNVETRYWFIELELAKIVWVLRKIRHMIEIFALLIMIYIDHDVALEIVKQISLNIASTNKLNLRLVRAFDYL